MCHPPEKSRIWHLLAPLSREVPVRGLWAESRKRVGPNAGAHRVRIVDSEARLSLSTGSFEPPLWKSRRYRSL